jgi:predicted RNA-binding Zn-ribbon protein involved in translation (DUF1610 family)
MTGHSTAISFTISESETMVEILCPHCEEEVELGDDASGTYICPHCDDGTQVTVCEHLRGPYTGGKDSKPSLSFFI